MPVVLPTDHIGETRVDDLVHQDVVRDETQRTHDHDHAGHAEQGQALITEQRFRGVRRHQADDLADERRDHRVQHGDQAAADEQRDGQAGHLADVEPVEPNQAGVWRRSRRAGGGVEQGFEAAQHIYQRWTLLAASSIGFPLWSTRRVESRSGVDRMASTETGQDQWPCTQYGPSQCGGTQIRLVG
jgi:hypothetical protein